MDGRRALVVDDSKSARFAMRRLLEGLGCRVDTADSGEEALAAVRAQPPDLVFLDHIMPVMDGLEVLDRLNQDPATAGLPVVLCSSNDSAEFRQQVRRHGAYEVLVKPPASEQIAALLARLPQAPVIHAVAVPPPALVAKPVPVPGRVQTIRDPEETIEHAVMKTLRDALPSVTTVPGPPQSLPLSPPPAPLTSVAPPPSVQTAMTATERRDPQQRGEIEARLRHITQDLFAQLGEVRAQVSHLEAQVVTAQQAEDDRSESTVAALGERIDSVALRLDEQLRQLREELLARLETQNEATRQRLGQIAREVHDAAIEEAHAVSERVVMNAAKRISDQIADSILAVVKSNALHQTG